MPACLRVWPGVVHIEARSVQSVQSAERSTRFGPGKLSKPETPIANAVCNAKRVRQATCQCCASIRCKTWGCPAHNPIAHSPCPPIGREISARNQQGAETTHGCAGGACAGGATDSGSHGEPRGDDCAQGPASPVVTLVLRSAASGLGRSCNSSPKPSMPRWRTISKP